MDKGGWVKVYRQLFDHWLWNDKPFSKGQAWIDLIGLANYEDGKTPYNGEIITCERGTVYRSISFLSKRWGWSRDKTRTFLKLLESDSMIRLKATTNHTTITIVNYSKFQDSVTTDSSTNRQRTSQRTDSESYNERRSIKNDKNTRNARARGVYFENQRKDDLDGDVLKNILGRLNANGEITKAVSGDE